MNVNIGSYTIFNTRYQVWWNCKVVVFFRSPSHFPFRSPYRLSPHPSFPSNSPPPFFLSAVFFHFFFNTPFCLPDFCSFSFSGIPFRKHCKTAEKHPLLETRTFLFSRDRGDAHPSLRDHGRGMWPHVHKVQERVTLPNIRLNSYRLVCASWLYRLDCVGWILSSSFFFAL